jgi:lipopolysaccharide biosynthesis glycosyltransferase
MICDDNFVMPTSVAVTSLIANKADDTRYDVYVVMAECSEESKNIIAKLDKINDDCNVNIIETGLDKYRSVKQVAHVPIACLLKFDICDLITGYDKLIYLDGDIVVREDLTQLFNVDLKGKYAAAVKEIINIDDARGNINAGIMLFNAKRIRGENLSKTLYETRMSLGDKPSMDQQTFNIVTKKDYVYLPIKYNCICGYLVKKEGANDYSIGDINRLYGTDYRSKKEIIETAAIYHFASGNKPWVYTFNTGADEWYRYYKMSPVYDPNFKRIGLWEYRWQKLSEAWRRDGLRGVWGRVADKCRRTFHFHKKSQGGWE